MSYTSPFTTLGNKGGEVNHTLTTNEMPSHVHDYGRAAMLGSESANNGAVYTARGVTGQQTSSVYMANANDARMRITATGGDAPHNNMSPYIVVNYEVVAG